jgi:hypothetical protein
MSTISTPAAALQLYIDGIANGDAAALESAFHPDARMFGALGGQRVDIPISDMMAMVAAQPANVDGSFKATVRSIEEHGDVASATVDEENFWGSVSFTDVFSLVRINDSWQIVGKIFTHTGGTPPGA